MTTQNPYTHFGQLRPEKKIVAGLLKEKKFNSVLEVGTQWGENLDAIRGIFPSVKMVGVDADWDGILQEAKNHTGLDIRKGDVFNLGFKDKEFDVVFTNALFCMLKPQEIEVGLSEIIRVANKYIILVELETEELVGTVLGGRTGANWSKLFEKYNLEVSREKIPQEVWNVEPWITFGYVYVVSLEKEIKPTDVPLETGIITDKSVLQKELDT